MEHTHTQYEINFFQTHRNTKWNEMGPKWVKSDAKTNKKNTRMLELYLNLKKTHTNNKNKHKKTEVKNVHICKKKENRRK